MVRCGKLTTTSLATKAKGTVDSSLWFYEFVTVKERKVMSEREGRREKNQQEERNKAQSPPSPATVLSQEGTAAGAMFLFVCLFSSIDISSV